MKFSVAAIALAFSSVTTVSAFSVGFLGPTTINDNSLTTSSTLRVSTSSDEATKVLDDNESDNDDVNVPSCLSFLFQLGASPNVIKPYSPTSV